MNGIAYLLEVVAEIVIVVPTCVSLVVAPRRILTTTAVHAVELVVISSIPQTVTCRICGSVATGLEVAMTVSVAPPSVTAETATGSGKLTAVGTLRRRVGRRLRRRGCRIH